MGDNRNHLQDSASATMPRWKKVLACLALLCAVGLYSIEATHHHRNAQGELRCPVCHVMGHNALDVYSPDLGAAFALAMLFYLLIPAITYGIPGRFFFLKPQTRAPPVLAFSLI